MRAVYLDSHISKICLHKVGNKMADESISYSTHAIGVNEEIKKLLITYFLSPLITEEYFHLYHDSDIKLNEVYAYVSKIFDKSDELYEQSIHLAKHLYNQSTHPKIKGGEFYTVYFKDCILDGKTVDAVGLFKSENKDTFLKVLAEGSNFDLRSEQGINIKKLDKGCLIFNTEREKGYVVAVVDNTNKGVEAQYWIDDFLHVRVRKDNYSNTQNIMSLAKDFVTQALPQVFEITKADQIDLLNRSLQFFKEKGTFELNDFTHEVMAQPEVIEQFHAYKQKYEQVHDLAIDESFSISDVACKKGQRSYKRIICLDKKIKIIIDGNREHIEQGEDERGKFYKVYYDKED